jgi:hypothetical protein
VVDGGAAVPIDTLFELSRHWYDGRLDVDHVPQTPAERQAQLTAAGLTSAFWQLS